MGAFLLRFQAIFKLPFQLLKVSLHLVILLLECTQFHSELIYLSALLLYHFLDLSDLLAVPLGPSPPGFLRLLPLFQQLLFRGPPGCLPLLPPLFGLLLSLPGPGLSPLHKAGGLSPDRRILSRPLLQVSLEEQTSLDLHVERVLELLLLSDKDVQGMRRDKVVLGRGRQVEGRHKDTVVLGRRRVRGRRLGVRLLRVRRLVKVRLKTSGLRIMPEIICILNGLIVRIEY